MRLIVCAYDPRRDDLRLMWRDAEGPIGGFARLERELGASASTVRFSMNGGMYDPTQAPVGLLVQKGREAHPADAGSGYGNFHLLPNGVFWTDERGRPHVDETARFLSSRPKAEWATQSGPLLVDRGRLHPAIAKNGVSLAIRNGVGVCGPDARFVISDDPVSFGRFARFFRDGLGCRDALYLDGAVSSLWAPGLGRRDGRTGLGPLVLVSGGSR